MSAGFVDIYGAIANRFVRRDKSFSKCLVALDALGNNAVVRCAHAARHVSDNVH